MKNYEDITDDDGFLFDPDNWIKEFVIYNAKKLWLDL